MKHLTGILLLALPFFGFGQTLTENDLIGKWTLRHKDHAIKFKTKLTIDGKERTSEEPETWLRFKPDRELEFYFHPETLNDRYKIFRDTVLVLGSSTYDVLEITDSTLILKETGMLPSTFFYEKDGYQHVFKNQIAESSKHEVKTEKKSEKEFFMIVEQMPKYPDGDKAAFKYIADNLKFPELDKSNPVFSKVYVDFIVEADGSIEEVAMHKPTNKLLEDEVQRMFSEMPRWEPGKQNGKPVRVKLVWPINIELN
jgi:hypothetical protein